MTISAVLIQLVPVLGIFGVFYFLLIRPDVQRQSAHQTMVASLAKDDAVVTIGGVHGVIAAVGDTTIDLEISKGVRVVFDKTAVARKKDAKRSA
jgi:preprotein translocase subunit YajC